MQWKLFNLITDLSQRRTQGCKKRLLDLPNLYKIPIYRLTCITPQTIGDLTTSLSRKSFEIMHS
jgi:hypothetical protein